MELKVRTAQMSAAKGCVDMLDVTVKTGDIAFAPTWDMVMGIKSGKYTELDYTRAYKALMQMKQVKYRDRWLDLLGSGSVTLACYCGSGAFCHRLLLVESLQAFGNMNEVEVISCGEVSKVG